MKIAEGWHRGHEYKRGGCFGSLVVLQIINTEAAFLGSNPALAGWLGLHFVLLQGLRIENASLPNLTNKYNHKTSDKMCSCSVTNNIVSTKYLISKKIYYTKTVIFWGFHKLSKNILEFSFKFWNEKIPQGGFLRVQSLELSWIIQVPMALFFYIAITVLHTFCEFCWDIPGTVPNQSWSLFRTAEHNFGTVMRFFDNAESQFLFFGTFIILIWSFSRNLFTWVYSFLTKADNVDCKMAFGS